MDGTVQGGVAGGSYAYSGATQAETGDRSIVLNWALRGRWAARLQSEQPLSRR
jgi:hypothetical protein